MQWTEITDENMDAVYNMDKNRLVIAMRFLEKDLYVMYRDWTSTISTMAKMGGYYYIELPELSINENNNENYEQ